MIAMTFYAREYIRHSFRDDARVAAACGKNVYGQLMNSDDDLSMIVYIYR